MSGSEKENSEDQPRLDELIPLKKAAKLSGLSTSYLRRLVSQGEIWGKKLGRNWVTTEQALREFLARERRPGRKPKKRP
jgi:excisionase family DNA binding protein